MEGKKDLQAQLAIIVGLLLLFLWQKEMLLLQSAALLGIFFLLFPKWSAYISRGWWWLAAFLGKINGAILLSVLFFLFLTPLALLRKLFQKKSAQSQDSWYVIREHTFRAEDLENPF